MMLFLRALFMLLYYDLVSHFRPFSILYSTVKSWEVAPRTAAQDTIDHVCTAVNYACAWYPKHSLCLQRSFATTYLLRKQGVPAQMVLGAQKLPFKAHAWVEVNGQAVNERSSVQAYGVWERC